MKISKLFPKNILQQNQLSFWGIQIISNLSNNLLKLICGTRDIEEQRKNWNSALYLYNYT